MTHFIRVVVPLAYTHTFMHRHNPVSPDEYTKFDDSFTSSVMQNALIELKRRQMASQAINCGEWWGRGSRDKKKLLCKALDIG